MDTDETRIFGKPKILPSVKIRVYPWLDSPGLLQQRRGPASCAFGRRGSCPNRATVFCSRRLQFEFAAVPGTLKRSFRASRSVIMTIAIQAFAPKERLLMTGA